LRPPSSSSCCCVLAGCNPLDCCFALSPPRADSAPSCGATLCRGEQEKQERYKGLNTAEKVTLHTGRFFLANKYSRTFIFFYALALHLLVFLTLYKLANTATLRPAV
jgi:hypothetical protein